MPVGWQFEEFRAVTGFDLREDWSREMRQLVKDGWGELEPDRFRLNSRGLRFADTAAEAFLKTGTDVRPRQGAVAASR